MACRASVECVPFGVRRDGAAASLHWLRRGGGAVAVTDHGATVVAFRAPRAAGDDGDGASDVNVTFGFDSVAGYEDATRNAYFGCTVGRVCNRIGGATFALNGKQFKCDRCAITKCAR